MRENRRVYVKKVQYGNVFYCEFPRWTTKFSIYINFKFGHPFKYSDACTIQFRISPWFNSYIIKLVDAYYKHQVLKNPLLNFIINLKVFYAGKNFIMPE